MSSTSSLTSPLINIGGLATGLDTNTIIDQMMAAESIPLNTLRSQQTVEQYRQRLLQGFQSQMQSLSTAIQALHSTTLFTQTQGVTSSDATKLTASTTTGAGVGSYQVGVSQLANSAQRTYGYTTPASDGTITIDGHDTAVRAGESIQDIVNSINSDSNATVYAAATDSGTLVLSSRSTGDTGTGFIAVNDPTGTLTEATAKARQGRDAIYTIDGVGGSSRTNTFTDGIAGVSLSLQGVTTTSGPVTVTVSAPGADSTAITKALQGFVNSYNSTVDAIRARLTERSVPNATTTSDQEQGVLFGDPQLTGMLNDMRQAIYSPIAGLPAGMNSLADLGVSTGAASSATAQSSLDGDLTLDTSKLQQAITSNPTGVRDLLAGTPTVTGWGATFQTLVDGASQSNGLLATSITSSSSRIKDMQTQIDSMNTRLTTMETALRAQFTALEVSVQQSRTTGDWLTSQLAGLAANNIG
jgi:flagellar hook-associated protein 2